MHNKTVIRAAFPLLLLGCAGNQGEQVRDAHLEQANARADARENAVDHEHAARKEAINQHYDARERQGANEPGASANSKLNDISKDRAQYQSDAKAKLDKLAARINSAQQQIVALGSRAPTTLHDQLHAAAEEHELIRQRVSKLNDTPSSSWDQETHSLDQRMSALSERVGQLKDSIAAV